jgi:starvation-inducible DNA-binding protein
MSAPAQTRFPRSFRTSIDLAAPLRSAMAELLNRHLADVTDLTTQAKFAHWNVKGLDFIQLHELFDDVAEHLEDHTDLIAERITALGGFARGTARLAAAESSLPEFPMDLTEGRDYVGALSERLARFGAGIRRAIDESSGAGDQATADLLTEISRGVDKDLWFLEAHLQAERH